jgi:hypothetical protein
MDYGAQADFRIARINRRRSSPEQIKTKYSYLPELNATNAI